MKRRELIRQLTQSGCILLRSGKKHDIYCNPVRNLKQPIPRHSEVDDILAKHIKKYLGIE